MGVIASVSQHCHRSQNSVIVFTRLSLNENVIKLVGAGAGAYVRNVFCRVFSSLSVVSSLDVQSLVTSFGSRPIYARTSAIA